MFVFFRFSFFSLLEFTFLGQERRYFLLSGFLRSRLKFGIIEVTVTQFQRIRHSLMLHHGARGTSVELSMSTGASDHNLGEHEGVRAELEYRDVKN